MKTLEKDRKRRYPTANDLAADIQRHLKHEPVSAAAPSPLYRSGKLVRRHKAVIATATALITLLVAGAVVSTWPALRATQAERKAQTEAAKKDEVARLLKEMLRGIEPSVARGGDTTLLQEILERSVKRVRSELQGQPDVQAELLSTIGRAYWELGDYDQAESLWRETLAIVVKRFPDGGEVLVAGDGAGASEIFTRALPTRTVSIRRRLRLMVWNVVKMLSK